MSKNYKVSFFNKAVEEITLSLPDNILAHLLKIFEMAEEVGANLGRPHSAPLGDGLFEVRAKGKKRVCTKYILLCDK